MNETRIDGEIHIAQAIIAAASPLILGDGVVVADSQVYAAGDVVLEKGSILMECKVRVPVGCRLVAEQPDSSFSNQVFHAPPAEVE